MTIGQTISHYKILSKLGEGGMGVVYKAEDERLKRVVALKFLPQRAAGTEEDRARFLREAQAAAALDHPNICTVYEIDEAAGSVFLAMAFIEGRTLDKRIEEGPLPLKEAIAIASQAAQGLQAAHKRGVVHRDIKASNLMLSGDNPARPQVKLLDFGLAQLAGRSKLTHADSVVGTVGYMSPEQTEGAAVDQRTDIWSLGVLLYEMLAGELPFKGHYDQATLYSILNEEPAPLTSLRSGLPIEIDWIVEKCLAKSADERYRSMEDLLIDLATLDKKLDSQRLSIHRKRLTPMTDRPPMAPSSGGRNWKGWAIGLGALAAALLIAVIALGVGGEEAAAPVPERKVRQFEITLPQSSTNPMPQVRSLAIAPDGSRIAFTLEGEQERLWVRDLSQPAAYALDGTEGAQQVFWSPNSAWIGYLAGRSLHKIPSSGGPAQTLAEISTGFLDGGSWTPDGQAILFSAGPPFRLLEVSARGGEPKVLMESPGGRRNFPSEPQLLESGSRRLLLYSARTPQGSQLALRDLDSEEVTQLSEGEQPFYVATDGKAGFILYRGGPLSTDIWAMPFSAAEGKATGDPFPVAYGGELPTASQDGALVYAADLHAGPLRLRWVDRSGRTVEKIGRSQPQLRSPAVSPDGRLVAAIASDGGVSDVWIHNADGEVARRLTNTPENEFLLRWSPESQAVEFAAAGADGPQFYRAALAGGQPEKVELADGSLPIDSSRDGGRVLIRRRGPGQGGLALLERNAAGDYDLIPLGRSPGEGPGAGFGDARLSPDGRYLAQEVRDADQAQLILRDLEQTDRSWVVSPDGGDAPRWRADGRELYFLRGDEMFAVAVAPDKENPLGEPQALFRRASLAGGPRSPGYDVSPDGSRFVLVELPERPAPPTIKVVLNWLAQ